MVMTITVGVIICFLILCLYSKRKAMIEEQQRLLDKIASNQQELEHLKSIMVTQDQRTHEVLHLLRQYVPEVIPDALFYDPTRDYLSNSEWQIKSNIIRERLAVHSYAKSNKSDWEIGRDYELFVAYEYKKHGYRVDTRGSYLRLKDMGIDLIARRGTRTVLMQCKCWGKEKLIREKYIFQLYGALSLYKAEHPDLNGEIRARLVTSTRLSETAKQVAQSLGVFYSEEHEMGPFPSIKCCIIRRDHGIKEKYYYLPMDKNYDDMRIHEEEGEFLAWDVAEAVESGFRRAYPPPKIVESPEPQATESRPELSDSMEDEWPNELQIYPPLHPEDI